MKCSSFLLALAVVVHTSAARKTRVQQAVLERGAAKADDMMAESGACVPETKEEILQHEGPGSEEEREKAAEILEQHFCDGNTAASLVEVGTNGTNEVSSTESDGASCTDNHEYCHYWKDQYCVFRAGNQTNEWVRTTCPETCGLCNYSCGTIGVGTGCGTRQAFVDSNGHLTIPEGETSIEEYSFTAFMGLTSITIPDSVTSIGEYAFASCEALTSVNIPDGVTSIETSTFETCVSLTSVTIPDNVTSIGSYAFSQSGLTSVTIPDSVTTIESDAFRGCTVGCTTALTSVHFGEDSKLKHIGERAFQDTPLTEITFGPLVVHIGAHAFAGTGITEVTVPHGCYLGHNAFEPTVAVSVGYSSMLGEPARFDTKQMVGAAVCEDSPGWYDADGPTYDCAWYADGTHCADYGNGYSNMGKTANEACCACSSAGLIQVENSAVETPFLRDCRVLAEIAEKGGVLDKCMGGGAAVDQECKDTLTKAIENRQADRQEEKFSVARRNECYECFISSTGSDCVAEMNDCKSTVMKPKMCGNGICLDSDGNERWTYSGPETSGSTITTTTPDDYKKSDRLYGCFGHTGEGLDPAMLLFGHELGLLEQRAERGTLNTTAFMKSSSSKA